MRTIKYLSPLLTFGATNVQTIRKPGYTPVLNRLRAFLFLGFIIFSLASCSTKNDPKLIDNPTGNTDPDGNTNSGGNNNPGGNNSSIPASSRNAHIVQIEENGHVFVLLSDNTLWGVGRNYYSELGLPKFDYNTLTLIAENVKFVKALFGDNTLIIKTDDTLWGCGRNHYGELGQGHTEQVFTFTKIADNVRSVAGGLSSHLLFIKKDNTLWGCGNNSSTDLAFSDEYYGGYYKTTPVKIADDVKEASAGTDYSFMIKNDNSVWSRGGDVTGKRGLGQAHDGFNYNKSWVKIPHDGKKVFAGVSHSAIIKSDNSLWLAGSNDSGEFGIGLPDSDYNNWYYAFIKAYDNVKDVMMGVSETTILLNNNTLWVTGEIDATDYSKTLYTWTKVADDVQKVAGRGFDNAVVLKNDGTLWRAKTEGVPQPAFEQISLPWKN